MFLCHAFVVTRVFISPTISQNKPLHKYFFIAVMKKVTSTRAREICVLLLSTMFWGWESGPVVLRCFLISSLNGVQCVLNASAADQSGFPFFFLHCQPS